MIKVVHFHNPTTGRDGNWIKREIIQIIINLYQTVFYRPTFLVLLFACKLNRAKRRRKKLFNFHLPYRSSAWAFHCYMEIMKTYIENGSNKKLNKLIKCWKNCKQVNNNWNKFSTSSRGGGGEDGYWFQ